MKAFTNLYSFTGIRNIGKISFIAVLCLLMASITGYAQTLVPFATAGTTTWTVPTGVYSITVECWGAGGAGGGQDGPGNGLIYGSGAAGGGGGGAYVISTQAVTPGTTYSVTVGAGGAIHSGSGGGTGGTGSTSWFGSATTVAAVGGVGGAALTTGTSGSNLSAGGAGGAAASCYPSSGAYSGGNGAAASDSLASGPGGGGAGSTGAGGNATTTTGGTGASLNGGNGGNEETTAQHAGIAGSNYGGGGSGCTSSGVSNYAGGAGAQGLVHITYTPAPTPYYWVGYLNSSTDWQSAANWNTTAGGGGTTRTSPASNDVLIIRGDDYTDYSNNGLMAPSLTITDVPAQTIGSLQLTSYYYSPLVSLVGATSGNVLTIGNTQASSIVTSGVLDIGSNLSLIMASGSTFNNAGSYTTSGGGTTTINGLFNFTGASQTAPSGITVSASGELRFSGSGTPTISGPSISGIFTVGGTVSSISGTSASYSGTTTLQYTGTAAVTIGSEWGSGTPLNVVVNNSAGVSNSNSLSIAEYSSSSATLQLISGTFSSSAGLLTIANGSSITVTAGTLSGAPTFGSTVNVSYVGNSVTTGSEIPASSTVLNNLTISLIYNAYTTPVVSLGSSATVNGTLALTLGTLALGANTLTVNGIVTTGTGTIDGSGSTSSVLAFTGSESGNIGTVILSAASLPDLGTLNLSSTGTNPTLTLGGTIDIANSIVLGGGIINVASTTIVSYRGTSSNLSSGSAGNFIAFIPNTYSSGFSLTNASSGLSAGPYTLPIGIESPGYGTPTVTGYRPVTFNYSGTPTAGAAIQVDFIADAGTGNESSFDGTNIPTSTDHRAGDMLNFYVNGNTFFKNLTSLTLSYMDADFNGSAPTISNVIIAEFNGGQNQFQGAYQDANSTSGSLHTITNNSSNTTLTTNGCFITLGLPGTNIAAHVGNFIWTGGNYTQQWEDPGNWSGGGGIYYPGTTIADVATVNSSGTVGGPIITSASGNLTLATLTISGSGNTVTLAEDAYVAFYGVASTSISLSGGGTIVADPTSTIEYADPSVPFFGSCANCQIINSGFTYGNLYLSSGPGGTADATKYISSTTNIAGNLTLATNCNLTMNYGTYNVNLGGNMTFTGTGGISNAATTPIVMNTNGSTINASAAIGAITASANISTIASSTINNLAVTGGSTFTIPGGISCAVGTSLSNSGDIGGSGTLSLSGTMSLPGSGTNDATLNVSMGSGSLSINASTTVNNFSVSQTVGNSNTTLTGGNLTVNGTLSFTAGNIATGSYAVIIPSGGSISGAGQSSGWVNGNLQSNFASNAGTSTFTYTIGDATEYAPATLAINNINATSPVNITGYISSSDANESYNSGIDQSSKANRYWFLSESGGGTYGSYSATFDFTNCVPTGTTASYIVRKFDPSAWAATSSTVSGTTITATGLSTIGTPSDFEVGQRCVATSNSYITTCNSYLWNGTTYNTSGTYTYDAGNSYINCDSVATLNLTINYSNSSTNTVSACTSYLWNGTTYYTGGSYSYDAGNNAAGCDSVANLNLTITSTSTSSTLATACDSYVWNGNTYTTGGTYTYDAGNNAAGCDSVATLILTINYSPTVSITGLTAICMNATTTLSPTSGGTWASSDNTLATVTNGGVVTGVAPGSPTFTFTTDAGCSATTSAVTINNCCVAPAAPTGSSPQSFCSGMPHTVANLAVTGTDIKVYSVATGGTALASTVTLANGKTYYASQTVGCESSRLPVAVVINGSPAVSGIAGAAAVCASSSTTLTSITLTDATAGGVWSVTPGTGTASIDDSGNLTGLTAGSVIVSYAVTAVNGCTTTPTKAVNVNATPVASIASSLSPICNKTRTAIVLASSKTPATYSYTASGDVFVTGFVSGKAAVIAQTLTNTGTTQGVVTYTVTPVYAGCTGSAITTSVTVNPVATGTATPSPDPICTGATTGITLNPGAVAGITFSWTYVNTVTVTGANSCAFTDGTCGTSINDLLSNSGTVNGTNTYSITPWANGCAGTVFRDVVTVRPVPTVSTVDGSTTICNKTRTDIVFTGTTAGTIYTHTASGDVGTSGFSTGTGVTIAQTLYNSGATPGVVTYTITPTYDGCPGASITANVTVNPVATGSATPAANAICSGTSAGLTLNEGPVSGTSFEYTSVSTVLVTNTVTGATASCTSGCGTSITDVLSNGGTANGTTTYTITPWANGCAGTAFKDIVTVRPVPVVYTTVSSPYSVCSRTKTYIPLKSYTAGATFSFSSSDIDGLVSGYLDGSGALIAQTLVNTGTAQGVVTYSVTPTYELCDGAAITIPVTVNPVATGSATPSPQGICTGFAAGITLIPGSVSGTNFTWVASVVSTISGATSCADTSGACGTMINSVLHSTATSPVEIYTITPYANGCAGTKFIEDVTVQSGNPVKPAIVGTSTKICPATDYTYTVSNLGSFTDVIWTIPSGCTITTGSLTSNPIVIEYPEGYSSGTLTAIATNQCGNASTTGSLATNTRGSSCRISENTSPEVGSSMNMTAYPNPAHDVLNVQFNRDQAGSYKLELMDLTGRLMLNQVNAAQQGSNLVEIALGNYAKGVYMLSLTTDDGNRQVVRIVVE